jgi:LysR family hydrogen peroxide-inducible transcriptional activator
VETNQLKYLSTVAERGSFSKAALHCFISQSALSEQIQKLEEEVGATLLDRSRRIIVPTEAGRIFITHAGQVLAQLARATREIQGLNGINSGKVVLGVLPTIAPYLLPHILESFAARCSNVELNIHEDMTVPLLRLIEDGSVDLGIVSSPIKERGFETETLFSEEMLLALHPRHPLSKKRMIFTDDLRSEKFILLQNEHCLGNQVIGYCSQHDFHPRILFECGQLVTVQSLVAGGIGISLIPQMAISATPTLIYRQLENPRPKRTIAVVTRSKSHLKVAVQEFLKHLRQVGKTFGRTA